MFVFFFGVFKIFAVEFCNLLAYNNYVVKMFSVVFEKKKKKIITKQNKASIVCSKVNFWSVVAIIFKYPFQ